MFISRSVRRVCHAPRRLFTAARQLLSRNFALDDEWRARHAAFRELGIEGGYEWITAVQKKFISAGTTRLAFQLFSL
ncbi:unnamed protein product [Gongylonema pulchrum]|uniref:Uncharacterized protein n=1 Tax=Gongylonema pulchrum TaxID=637853 RepID=A0A183D2H8_9BILA|nr:unnamed protein product [Gongylonema pulchrum]